VKPYVKNFAIDPLENIRVQDASIEITPAK